LHLHGKMRLEMSVFPSKVSGLPLVGLVPLIASQPSARLPSPGLASNPTSQSTLAGITSVCHHGQTTLVAKTTDPSFPTPNPTSEHNS
jgi:hypothetical protein